MRNKTVSFTLLALLALGLASCAKLQARDNVNKGIRAFRETHYEAAVNYFQEAVKLDPSLTVAEIYLAMAYAQQYIPGAISEENRKNAEMAIATFDKVLQREPDNVSAVAGLASVYQNDGHFDKAREYYIRYSELEPQNAEAHYGVGSVNWIIVFDKNNPQPPDRKLALIEEGQKHLDQALAVKPDYDDAMTYKNLLFRQRATLTDNEEEQKQYVASADEWFNKAIETRKRNQEKKSSGGGIVIDNK